MFPRKTHT